MAESFSKDQMKLDFFKAMLASHSIKGPTIWSSYLGTSLVLSLSEADTPAEKQGCEKDLEPVAHAVLK